VRWLLLTAVLTAILLVGTALFVASRPSEVPPSDGPRAIAALPTTCATPPSPGSGIIATVAGGPDALEATDGIPAFDSVVELTPGGAGEVAIDTDGSLFISEGSLGRIRRIDPAGVIHSFSGEDPDSPLVWPIGMAFDTNGQLLVADAGRMSTPWLWSIDGAGIPTPIAGTGVFGSLGDGGPASDAQVRAAHVAIGPDGRTYLDDASRYRVIDRTGVIDGFAGTGTPGYSGDGAAAIESTFGASVEDVAVDAQGNVYLADTTNHRIRRVDTAGTITTVAGNGQEGYDGDGGQAADATIADPLGLDVDIDGNLFFSDSTTHTVRRVDRDGVITTVAGNGTAGGSGDCGPATEAQLDQPLGIAVRDGILYIADTGNDRIRMVMLPS
jgi:hypothetical protein